VSKQLSDAWIGAPVFGRAEILEELIARSSNTGVTAMVGRPLAGKTWTLLEVRRRLNASADYLVGYAEARDRVSSLLLYAMMDLYTRWLENEPYPQQAPSLWERFRSDLVPSVGKMFGPFASELGKNVPLAVVGRDIRNCPANSPWLDLKLEIYCPAGGVIQQTRMPRVSPSTYG
jgi:hypothetical protein